MKNLWDNVAKDWNSSMANGDWFQRSIIYPTVCELLPDVRDRRVLDVGCGNGHLCRFLTERGACVTGIDKSEGMIEACRSYGSPVTYFPFDITEGVPDAPPFDIAVFNNSLQDMDNFERGLQNAGRALGPHGLLLICVKHPCFHPSSDEHGWRIRRADGTYTTSGPGLTDLSHADYDFTGEYFINDRYYDGVGHTRNWYGNRTASYARTLEVYLGAVLSSGFSLLALREPRPRPEAQKEKPQLYDLLQRIPNFIFLLAEKTED